MSVCGFVVNGSGYSVVGNRNTKVPGMVLRTRLSQKYTLEQDDRLNKNV